ncbi:MAG: hypothetical protein JW757_01670 [Anaerolineales bacterium]|nr:hypothetical protein [Anaerolineales bacterium]
MKNFGNMLTGLMISTFAYVAVLFLGIAAGYLLGYEYQSQEVLEIGLDFLAVNVIAGMLGGYLGGSSRGFNGALTGGLIAGVLAAAARLLLVYFGPGGIATLPL